MKVIHCCKVMNEVMNDYRKGAGIFASVGRYVCPMHYGLRGLQNGTKLLLTDLSSWSQVYHIACLFHLQILSISNIKSKLTYIHHDRKCMKPKLVPL